MNQSPQELSPEAAKSTLDDATKKGVPVFAIHFIDITEYTTFRAQLAITDGDLVFHFYVTEEVNARTQPTPAEYWLGDTCIFANTLAAVAQEYFNADYPRLKACYTAEQVSWWLRAYGFGQMLDPHKFAYTFLERLDAALDAAISKAA